MSKYLSDTLLDRVFAEFKWSAKYTISDGDIPEEGIEVIFPNCTLIFSEEFESEIDLRFCNKQTGREEDDVELRLEHAMLVVSDRVENSTYYKKPELADHFSPFASLEKVEIEVRNICKILQTYLLPCIEGDFSWVLLYNKRSGSI